MQEYINLLKDYRTEKMFGFKRRKTVTTKYKIIEKRGKDFTYEVRRKDPGLKSWYDMVDVTSTLEEALDIIKKDSKPINEIIIKNFVSTTQFIDLTKEPK